jgi:hypothetical protein
MNGEVVPGPKLPMSRSMAEAWVHEAVQAATEELLAEAKDIGEGSTLDVRVEIVIWRNPSYREVAEEYHRRRRTLVRTRYGDDDG